MKLIDKAAIVAEIERKMNLCKKILLRSRTRQNDDYHQGNIDAYEVVISLLDTLEVKEVGVDFGDPQGDIGVKWVQEEPVSNDLEEAADKHLVEKGYLLTTNNGEHLAEVEAKGLFKAGAKWQKEQMEKNRIEHCDNITEEQYNLETGFLDGFLDKNKRMPTFLDAIEYGMKKAQKG